MCRFTTDAYMMDARKNGRILRAQQDERRRLARELHDGVIQSLNAMRLQLQILNAEPCRTCGQAGDAMHVLADEALAAIDDVRQVSHDLHPSALERRELPAALASYAEYLGKESGLEIEISNHCNDPLSDHIYVENGVDRLTIQDSTATNRQTGIEIRSGSDIRVINNDLSDSSSRALYMVSVSEGTLPGGVEIWGNDYSDSTNGVYLQNISDLVISDGSVAGTNVNLTDSSGLLVVGTNTLGCPTAARPFICPTFKTATPVTQV